MLRRDLHFATLNLIMLLVVWETFGANLLSLFLSLVQVKSIVEWRDFYFRSYT